jgi:hypothetical protein
VEKEENHRVVRAAESWKMGDGYHGVGSGTGMMREAKGMDPSPVGGFSLSKQNCLLWTLTGRQGRAPGQASTWEGEQDSWDPGQCTHVLG